MIKNIYGKYTINITIATYRDLFFIFNKKLKNYVELIFSITHESIFYLKFNAILLCINFLLQ